MWFARVGDDECVVRGPKRASAALQWELDLLARLRDLGLGVPEVVPTVDGESTVGGIVVFRRVEGRRPASDNDWLLVRDYLGRVHGALVDVQQRPGFLAAEDLVTADAGGLVDLTALPDDAVARCRRAWARLAGMPKTVVHGDPGEENVFIGEDTTVLIDWDEARVDARAFDLAALPDGACPLSGEDRWVARQAASVWEAAISWGNDREYARWRLSELE